MGVGRIHSHQTESLSNLPRNDTKQLGPLVDTMSRGWLLNPEPFPNPVRFWVSHTGPQADQGTANQKRSSRPHRPTQPHCGQRASRRAPARNTSLPHV